jgi:TatD DNase family protein
MINLLEREYGYLFPEPITPYLIETHGHFHLYSDKPKELIETALNYGVSKLVYVACDLQSSLKIADFIKEEFSYKDVLEYSVGLHPNLVNYTLYNEELVDRELKKLEEILEADFNTVKRIKFIGECGLDFFRTPIYRRELQRKLFVSQLELANKYKKLLIIHNRDSGNELFKRIASVKMMKKYNIYHCYSQSEYWHMVTAIQYNFYLALGGAFTYRKNESLRFLAKEIPIERLLIETDAPYLPPQPWRGKSNSVFLLHHILREIANYIGIDQYDLSCKLAENFDRLLSSSPS